MNTNMLALASALSDHDLLARIGVPSLYAARGHGSLFTYCTDVLRPTRELAPR